MVADRVPEPSGSENERRSIRPNLAFGAAFLLALVGGVTGVFALVEVIPPTPFKTPIGVMDRILPNLETLRSSGNQPGLQRIAVLGDSTVDSYASIKKIPVRLEEGLRRSALEPESLMVVNLSFPALGSTSYYFLADRVVETRPDLIVWEVSLTHASERWRRSIPRPELAGWMAPARIPGTLAMPMEDIGLTADELLLYQLIVRLGAGEAWRDWLVNLSRVDKVRGNFEEWLSSITGNTPEKRFQLVWALMAMAALREGGELDRYNHAGEIEHFGKVLEGIDTDHPTLRFISATANLIRQSGIPLLVYLNPINMEHLEKVGVLEDGNIEKTLAAFHQTLHIEGVALLDLHDEFPDDHFSDMAGHFRHDHEFEAQTKLANILAAFIIDEEMLGPNVFAGGKED